MVAIGIVGSICFGNLPELNNVILNEGSRAIEFTIGLAAIMALWMGIMNIAKDSGLIDKIGKKLNPIMRRLFPSIPKGHKAMSYMVMNMALNMVGAGNGATAFGLKAMEELQTLNNKKDTATNVSSIQIIPFTMLKIRLDMGAQTPSDIILTTLFATTMSTIIAVISCKLLQGRNR